MTTDKHPLNDLLALSMQLNRQAFARPPMEGWLNSFLSMMVERFSTSSVQGVQVMQIIGNVAVQMGNAGGVPVGAEQHTLDETSPVTEALRNRKIVVTQNSHIYPIMLGDDPAGVLIAYLTKPGEIMSKTTDNMIGALATQLGPAIWQTPKTPGPQTGRLTRQVDMMRSLYEVTKTFSSTLESEEVSKRAVRSLVDTLKIDHASIFVFDKGGGIVVAEYPDHGHVGTRVQFIGSPLYRSLLETHQPVIIQNVDTSNELGVDKEIFQKLGIKAMAVVPMFVQDELIGVVTIDVYYASPEFNNDSIEAATTIAAQLAITVRNAQVYDQIKTRASQLEQITDLSRRVTSTFDRNRIFQIVREETHKMINTDLISVALKSGDNQLDLYILGDGEPKVTEFAAEQTALRFVCNTAEPLVLDDISGSDYPDYKLLAEMGMRAAVVVPLVIGGQAIGTYNVTHREASIYSSIDLAVLEQIGHQLAIALENARLYTQTLQRVEGERLMNRLSGGIQGRGDLQSMLLSTMQEMAEALGARRARIRLQMPAQSNLDSGKLLSLSGKLRDKLSEKREN